MKRPARKQKPPTELQVELIDLLPPYIHRDWGWMNAQQRKEFTEAVSIPFPARLRATMRWTDNLAEGFSALGEANAALRRLVNALNEDDPDRIWGSSDFFLEPDGTIFGLWSEEEWSKFNAICDYDLIVSHDRKRVTAVLRGRETLSSRKQNVDLGPDIDLEQWVELIDLLPPYIPRNQGWMTEQQRRTFTDAISLPASAKKIAVTGNTKSPSEVFSAGLAMFDNIGLQEDEAYREQLHKLIGEDQSRGYADAVFYRTGERSIVGGFLEEEETWLNYIKHFDCEIIISRSQMRGAIILRDKLTWAEKENLDLVSPKNVQQDAPMPGATITPAGEPGSPQLRQRLPVPEAGHELTRPAQTPPVEWPAAGWQKLQEKGGAKKMHAIVEYLRTKWKPFLDATGAAVTLEILEQKDPGAGRALRRYLERHPMPDDLRFVRHDELMNILAERPTRLVDVTSCSERNPGP